MGFTLLIVVIILALIFDYINGFHDAANSIATVVSTKVLTPFQAVLWAAVFNFAAYFIFKDHGVANTVAKTVKEDVVSGQLGTKYQARSKVTAPDISNTAAGQSWPECR